MDDNKRCWKRSENTAIEVFFKHSESRVVECGETARNEEKYAWVETGRLEIKNKAGKVIAYFDVSEVVWWKFVPDKDNK